MLDRVAETLQPRERGIFNYGFREGWHQLIFQDYLALHLVALYAIIQTHE